MIGRTLDRYLIEAKLGEGGMGAVYRALDTHLNRTVAITILPQDRVVEPAISPDGRLARVPARSRAILGTPAWRSSPAQA